MAQLIEEATAEPALCLLPFPFLEHLLLSPSRQWNVESERQAGTQLDG